MLIKIFYGFSLAMLLAACSSSKKPQSTTNDVIIVDDDEVIVSSEEAAAVVPVSKSVGYSPLQVKYAKYIGTSPAEIKNIRLYRFIDYWLHTPYLWGGTTKNGIDCSAFVQKLIDYVYTVNIPRTSEEQFFTQWIEIFDSKKYLEEGDLVFFKTRANTTVSHIGFYLDNNMFVNSSSSKGVSIASLDDPYWRKKYVACGRIKKSELAKYRR